MDDAIDQMNKTAKTIVLFEFRAFEPQMQQMGDIILQVANLVRDAMPLLELHLLVQEPHEGQMGQCSQG
jgi:hypothetical protein